MNPANGPTPSLLIDNDTVISDEMWLSGYIDTALRSFNVIGGFYKGEIQNRLVISVDSDTILLIYGLTLPFYKKETDSKRLQSYQAVITFIFNQSEEIEHKLYRLVNRIKHELELVSFTIQASNRIYGHDSFQNLSSLIQTLFTNGETLIDSVDVSIAHEPSKPHIRDTSNQKFYMLSNKERNVVKLGLPYLETNASLEDILEQTGLTYTELTWISRNLEKGKIDPTAGPYDKIIHDHEIEKPLFENNIISHLRDRLFWRRRRKVSHYLLKELNRTLFLLIEDLLQNNPEGRTQAQNMITQEAVLLGKRLLADYFSDIGLQEINLTHNELKIILQSIWYRNFGYSPNISAFYDSKPDHFTWLILIKDKETSLVGYDRHFGGTPRLCTIIEGVYQGIIEDLINLDSRFTSQANIYINVREIRCQSKGYDHCDFEINVRFNHTKSELNNQK